MIEDAEELAPGAEVPADVCVVGGGPAGITLGIELDRAGRDVLVLESGGLEREPAADELLQGETAGVRQFPLGESRMRMLGGASNHWQGFCGTFDALDLRERAWVPRSGWPLPEGALSAAYPRAFTLCGLPPEPELARAREEFRSLSPFGADEAGTRLLYFSPAVRFGLRYRDQLTSSSRLRVLVHATATGMDVGKAGTVTGLDVATLRGRRFRVRPRVVVLAAGGLENARLFLSSPSAVAALGPAADHVGRFFLDHPRAYPGGAALLFDDRLSRYFRQRVVSRTSVATSFCMPEAEQERRKTLNHGVFLAQAAALDRSALPKEARSVGAALAAVAGASTPMASQLNIRIEQCPSPESRVTLLDRRDPLGMPRVRLDWRLGDLDRHTFVAAAEWFGDLLGRHGLGRVWLAPWMRGETDPWWTGVGANWHHMGTTRMARTAADGVVDPDCLAFGTRNLFVAGSSVFPTGGAVNPTLTLVAMTVRLAATLAARGR